MYKNWTISQKFTQNKSFNRLENLSLYIVLVGGNTLYSGFESRLKSELEQLSSLNSTVYADENRKHSVWIGGSVLASFPGFDKMWVRKQDYEEYGCEIVHKMYC